MKNYKSKLITLILLSFSLFLISCSPTSKESNENSETTSPIELTISAAASLKEAMGDIQSLYKDKYPNVTLTFNFGSSGSLQKQIQEGAPSDVFISAGQSQMKALEDDNLILDGTNKNLVVNSLVLVGPIDTTLTSLDDLTTDKVKKIASGEPSSVPAGKYANEVLTNLNILDKVNDKLVFAKDVKEVLTWATSGNADVGFVYLSDAKASSSAKIIATVPENLHSSIIYPIGVIKDSKNQDEAKAFEEFLFNEDCKKVFDKYGYALAN